jgi:hypothetical protein
MEKSGDRKGGSLTDITSHVPIVSISSKRVKLTGLGGESSS